MATAKLLGEIATELLKIYKSPSPLISIVADTLLSHTELTNALTAFNGERLFGEILQGQTKVSPQLMASVIAKIKEIQTNTRNLTVDGVLGEKTLGWFNLKPFACLVPRPGELKPSTTTATPGGTGLNAIRYFVVNDEMPDVEGLNLAQKELVFSEALGSWADVCNIVIRRTGERTEANIIVSVEKLNMGVNVLGVGDIGPPNGNQLRLRFEKFRQWTPDLFFVTAAHEFGHCLGLRHEDVTKSGQLMNPRRQDGVFKPSDQDVAVAKKLWGPPRA